MHLISVIIITQKNPINLYSVGTNYNFSFYVSDFGTHSSPCIHILALQQIFERHPSFSMEATEGTYYIAVLIYGPNASQVVCLPVCTFIQLFPNYSY